MEKADKVCIFLALQNFRLENLRIFAAGKKTIMI